MMSRGFWLIVVARLGGARRGSVEHSKGKGGKSVVAIPRFLCGSPRPCRLSTAPFWLRWSFELCTDYMSGFMGPDKPSSFYNYFVESHLPTSCGAFYFWRENEVECQYFIQEQRSNFDLVGTCELLPYIRAPGSQAYDVLVKFFPCRVYIDSSHRDTLDYEWHLAVGVIS
jgi:hypothetical protein